VFGFEKKIKIPYSHIEKVSKEFTAVVIPNAVAIITAKREYFFRSFWDREEAYQLLTGCLNRSRGVVTAAPTPVAPPPVAASEAVGAGAGVGTSSSSNSSAGTGNGATAQHGNDRASSASRDGGGGQPRPSVSRANLNGRGRCETVEDTEEMEETDDDAMQSDAVDPLAAFEKMRGSKSFTDSIPAATFSMGLDEFVTAFLMEGPAGGGDALGLGLPAYHQEIGDTEVEVNPWDKIEGAGVASAGGGGSGTGGGAAGGGAGSGDDGGSGGVRGFLRTFRFRTPIVGSPIGPKSTRASKTQCCRVYATHGLVIDTVTRLEDIPFGDCFDVEDRWIVVPSADGSSLELTVFFQIHWIKGTWLKKTIESKTKVDVSSFQSNCVAAMQAHVRRKRQAAAGAGASASASASNQALGGSAAGDGAASDGQKAKAGAAVLAPAPAPAAPAAASTAVLLLLVLVLLAQAGFVAFYVYQVRARDEERWSQISTELQDIKAILASGGSCKEGQ
jgi:hypothetical protein